jgi:uncharacterized protein (DUF952 family)
MATIFHLALASDWAAAQSAGAYTTSTRGLTLAEVGFIHASRGDQWPAIRDAFYADVTEPLLLLQIDTDRLDVPVVEERPAPGATETFPHIYGPLALDAVVKAMPVRARGSSDPGTTGADSFGRVFLTEMFFNMALVILILLTTAAGLAAGNAIGGEVVPFVGVAAGALVGIALARWIYVRRHAA